MFIIVPTSAQIISVKLIIIFIIIIIIIITTTID